MINDAIRLRIEEEQTRVVHQVTTEAIDVYNVEVVPRLQTRLFQQVVFGHRNEMSKSCYLEAAAKTHIALVLQTGRHCVDQRG